MKRKNRTKTICLMFTLAACWFMLAVTRTSAQAVFYVDPVNGSDASDGSSTNSAFRTIGRAATQVRGVNATMSGDITVYLRGGAYFVTNTIVFTAADSGVNGFNVIYAAFPGEQPMVSGGRRISGWKLFDSTNHIYQAPVDPLLEFRQIYVNGERAVRARWPNLTNSATFSAYFKAISSSPFVVNSLSVGGWSNLNQVECVWIAHWHEKRARISSIAINGIQATLAFMSPESGSAVLNQYPNDNSPGFYTWYYFENAYEFLDQEGEWYLNTTTHTLYYKPRAGEDPDTMDVCVPGPDTLLSLAGTPAAYIHNLQFRGLLFELSNWTGPNSHGYLNWQAGYQLETDGNAPVPGMVQIDYGRQLVFEDNTFRFSGAHALTTINNTTSNLFQGNIFTNLAAGGIYVNTAGTNNGASTADQIRNNLFDRIGQVYSDCIPILAPNVAYDRIEHNTIRNCPYTGISIGWSWTDADVDCHDNFVQFNLIHDVMQLHDDGGGIYSLGRMTNGFIAGNYVYGVSPSPYQGGYPLDAIYLDNGSCYKTVQSNICDRVPQAFYAINPTNYNNTIQDNYYNTPFGSVALQNIIKQNYYVAPSSAWPMTALEAMLGAGLEPGYRRLDPLAQAGSVQLGGRLLALTNGMVIFDLAGPTNSIVAIQRSNDLNSWQSLVTNKLTGATAAYTNGCITNSGFFRAMQLQP